MATEPTAAETMQNMIVRACSRLKADPETGINGVLLPEIEMSKALSLIAVAVGIRELVRIGERVSDVLAPRIVLSTEPGHVSLEEAFSLLGLSPEERERFRQVLAQGKE